MCCLEDKFLEGVKNGVVVDQTHEECPEAVKQDRIAIMLVNKITGDMLRAVNV